MAEDTPRRERPDGDVAGTGQIVTVRSRKYDGRLHREWRAQVVARCGELIILEGAFEDEVRHPLLGHIPRGTLSTEYYWADRWYSVFRFREPVGGRLLYYYCNVNAPPVFDGSVLSFVDLDVDILLAADYSFKILDEDEFESNYAALLYPPEFRRRTSDAVAELIALIEARAFPFDDPLGHTLDQPSDHVEGIL
jgi:protein associated with RNAse G/E